jgi:signal transduction histidine kinase
MNRSAVRQEATATTAELDTEAPDLSSPGFFPLDPVAMAGACAPRVIWFHVIVAVLVCAVGCSAWGTRTLGVHPFYIAIGTFVFVVELVDAVRWVRDGSLFRPPAALRRVLTSVSPLLYTACFAAPSHHIATPAWTFLIMAGAAQGIVGVSVGWTLGLSSVLFGLGFHLLAGTEITPLSTLAAALASGLTWLCAAGAQRMTRTAVTLEARAAVVDALAEEAREDTRRLAAAMSLHDGLSGMLFGLRARLETATSSGELRAPVEAFVRRARELLAPTRGAALLRPLLRELSDTYAVPLEIVGELSPDLDELEARDLAFSTIELTSNALRHRNPERVRVTISCGARRSVRVEAMGGQQPTSAAGGGRGTRHLDLRARSWGGSYTHEERATFGVSSVSWPRPGQRLGPGWVGIAMPLAASSFGVVVWAGEASTLATVFVMICIVLCAVGAALSVQSLRHTAKRIELGAATRATQGVSSAARVRAVALEETLSVLLERVSVGDLVGVRAAIDEAGARLYALLHVLEETSTALDATSLDGAVATQRLA